ncbi:MAG: hypothetical protein CVU17_05835 [Betaproteobacteria bacterium HGW-Betaproteobacteria-11]|jgi:putative endonuclease|nr:MAG: hypothetical protein CVU17_05835 [Betaproteobacteria bacterium HGW-Betaproteobacteria-11]
MSWFVYLLECTDGSIYTGIARDVEKRFIAHQQGKGARYTRSHPPLRVLASESWPDRGAALRAEWRLKQLTPQAKRAYAASLARADA